MPKQVRRSAEDNSGFEVWLRRQRRPIYQRLMAEYQAELNAQANSIARTFTGKREFHLERIKELRQRLALQSQLTGPDHFLNQSIKEQMRNSLMVLKAMRKHK